MRVAGAKFALLLVPVLGSPAALAEAAAQQAAASPNPLAGLDLGSFAATRDFPLFTPSRTPPTVEAPVEPEVAVVVPEAPIDMTPVPPPFKLIGIVVSGSEQVALLADESTGEIHRFGAGDGYEGWIMQIVDGRTVQFQNEDLNHTLTMFEEFEPPSMGAYGEAWNPDGYPVGDELLYDQATGQPGGPGDTGSVEGSGQAIDPTTGFPIDPNSGLPTDPGTGQAYDPATGLPIDANTGLPTDPATGQAYDPSTGLPIDPNTGRPIDPG
jgi:hypothetical protein